jgi:hypothetical protein
MKGISRVWMGPNFTLASGLARISFEQPTVEAGKVKAACVAKTEPGLILENYREPINSDRTRKCLSPGIRPLRPFALAEIWWSTKS